MEPARRFLEYAAAFEKAYEDDDWSQLEPYFTEDAVYSVTGEPPLGGEWVGRDAVLRQFNDVVNELDRRFENRLTEIVGAPKIGEGTIEFEWRGTYSTAGEADLVFGGTEHATFSGDRIARLVDTMEEGADQRIQAWLAENPA
ncbi:MAG: nuclear transport factor 2 family protein [Myxococcota bacterium]